MGVGSGGGRGGSSSPAASPSDTPIPNVGSYSFSIELTGRTSSLGSIANRVGIDPALLLLIYQKESSGRSFFARWAESFDVCNCSSRGPTNIQFDVFAFHFGNNAALLAQYRFEGDTVDDRYVTGLTPTFVDEFTVLRSGYADAVGQLCGIDVVGHPWYAAPSGLPPA